MASKVSTIAEIAKLYCHLGINAEMLKQAWTNDPSNETKELMDNLRTATLEAQLVMYELAKKQMQEEMFGGGTE